MSNILKASAVWAVMGWMGAQAQGAFVDWHVTPGATSVLGGHYDNWLPSGTIPEPATLGVLVVGGIMALGRGKKRRVR